MRRLFLLRHAKAVRSAAGGDRARGLTERGRRDAARVGQWLLAYGTTPDAALVSTSARTRETATLVLGQLATPPFADFVPDLYLAEPEAILTSIRSADPQARALLVIGHNPGIAELAADLAGHMQAPTPDNIAEEFPTAALAVLEFDIEDWHHVAIAGGTLTAFVTPALLRAVAPD